MAQPRAIFSQAFSVDVPLVSVTETVICTLAGIDTPYVSSVIRLIGWAQLTPGTTQTSIALAIRRTALAGALVGEANAETFSAAASQIRGQSILTEDAPGDVASMVYVLTAVQAGGVTNGSALQGYLMALVS